MASRILLVEDNALNRDMLSRRLTRRGFTVLVAEDGAEGVAMARREAPDLVLMDMSLPVLDGWAATRQLKADPATRGVPVIALTAHAMAGDREQAIAAGCDDFDTKPIELPRLLGKIEALLAPAAGARGPRRELVLPHAGVADLPAVRAFVADGGRAAGLAPDLVEALVLAADEVCSNVVEHAYNDRPPGPVTVAFERVDDATGARAELTVVDAGPAFDPSTAPVPVLVGPAETRPAGGLGWFLVRQVVDEWRYERRAERDGVARNVLTLVKRLPAPAPTG